MPETLTDAQKVLRNDTGIRMAAALETLASGVELPTVIAPEYDATQTYAVGDLVIYRGVLYRCTTAITTPEAWTAAHWTATSVSDEYRPAAAQDVIDAGKETAGLGLTGASVGDLVRVAAVDTNGKPTSWRKAPLCDIATNKNLLDNWYFVGGGSQLGNGIFPINQRGQRVSSSGYGIDRWALSAANIITITLPDTNEYLRLTRQDTSGNPAWVQIMPDNIAGKVITISMLYRGNITASETAGNGANLMATNGSVRLTSSADWTLVTTTRTAGTRSFANWENKVLVGVQMRTPMVSTDYIDILAIKVEFGTEQTLAHQEGGVWVLNEIPDYWEELAKCQKHFVRYKTGPYLFNAITAANGANLEFSLPIFMKKGTITVSGSPEFALRVAGTQLFASQFVSAMQGQLGEINLTYALTEQGPANESGATWVRSGYIDVLVE